MKIAVVLVWLSAPVILRRAWDMSRAWSPTWLSPISPSISARGTSAATESMTTMSMRAGPDEHVRDLQRLLARVGLGNQQRVGVDAELLARSPGPARARRR